MENQSTLLTQNQQLLWIGQELNPESSMYNMVMTYEIKGTILFPYFKEAFDKVVQKNSVFRSVFETYQGVVQQKYLTKIAYEVHYVDFSAHENPETEYEIWEAQRVQHIFNLNKIAFDCVLVKCAEEKYIWYINQHHLITDGWSTALVFAQTQKYYTELLENNLNVEEQSTPQFQDFANKAAQIESSSSINELKGYWKNKLEGYSVMPKLYHCDSSSLATASKRISLSLGKERTEKLKAFANQKGVRVWTVDLTLYNIFLTALFAYVYRVSDQEKLVIGSPTHNRTSKSFQQTIGFFVEIFPLIAQIEEGETFMTLLKKIQVESNSFLKNAKTGSSTSEVNRKFNVFFNYMLNTSNSSFNGFEVDTEWLHPGHTDPRHHLRLHVHDLDNTGEIKLYFDLNTSVFSESLQQEIPQHFLNILDAFINTGDQKIETTGFATLNEITKINEWNNATSVNFDVTETLLAKFEKQVQATPGNIAISFNQNKLTYAELHFKSNQVAHFLSAQGVQSNDIIAISLDRSLEMMIYIYGIIKAGAAYLPIDPKTPFKRVAYILEDSKSKVLFYNHEEFKNFDLKNIPNYHVNQIENKVEAASIDKLVNTVSSQDLAYVIYTSGSTGTPKGVKVSHQAICNRLSWMNNDYSVTSADVFLQKTPITFDVSVWELFWPLQIGATLVVEVPEGHKNPEQLVRTIQKNKVSQLHFVPSMLTLFLNTENVENCASIKRVFCSGEALPAATIQKTYELLQEVEVHNLYGPTEAAVDVSSWYCDPAQLSAGVPIGKPVANTQLYILDQNLNQLPIGLPGELHIGGVQLAEGYLNQEELTAEKFVANVFADNTTEKLYKTGDLARYREDGNIEYLGRIDTQVKLRGLRIELGEIESSLEGIQNISKAVVVVDVEKQILVAYYTGSQLAQNELQDNLASRLPEYMIPSVFILIKEFTYTSSGKVDRKKLPALEKEVHQQPIKRLPPTNEFEELVWEVWKEVLELENIGINENFIRLGGNSLQAISITSRLKKELELEVSITDVFDYPTIKTYAANVEQTILKLMNEF